MDKKQCVFCETIPRTGYKYCYRHRNMSPIVEAKSREEIKLTRWGFGKWLVRILLISLFTFGIFYLLK
ncbi:hypothetical protein LCGC14_0556800 [marine sediment metagenome]|uniref:Uncharacterized protein n=1 Tax=marine sediment metagenome TaxID=412755 RepID=A0A0F9S6W2_9ZZZZ